MGLLTLIKQIHLKSNVNATLLSVNSAVLYIKTEYSAEHFGQDLRQDTTGMCGHSCDAVRTLYTEGMCSSASFNIAPSGQKVRCLVQ